LEKLKNCGLDKICLSFDGFKNETYEFLRGGRYAKIKMKIIENLKKIKMPTVLFAVIAHNINEDEIPHLIKFACENNDIVTEIAFAGLFTGGKLNQYTYFFSDLHKKVSYVLGIDLEYFKETKRLYFNCYNLIQKLFPNSIFVYRLKNLFAYQYIFKVIGDKCKPYFSVNELKFYNKILEKILKESSKLKILLLLLKYSFSLKKVFKLFLNFYILPFKLEKFLTISFRGVSRFGEFGNFAANYSINFAERDKIPIYSFPGGI
jgi:hypothetical protein